MVKKISQNLIGKIPIRYGIYMETIPEKAGAFSNVPSPIRGILSHNFINIKKIWYPKTLLLKSKFLGRSNIKNIADFDCLIFNFVVHLKI